jgi:nucleoid DNA-binding protein
MYLTDLVRSVAERAGLTQKQARAALDATQAVITEQLQDGRPVAWTGFGTFVVRQRQGRMGVNPHTKERMVINPSTTPGFRASTVLKNRFRVPPE